MTSGQNPTVLFIPRWYPYPEDEMFGLFVRHHAEAVNTYNQVIVLYAHPVLSNETGVLKSIENGVLAYRMFYKVSPPGLTRILNPFRFFFAFRKLYKTICADGHQIDVSHVHVLTRTGLAAWWLKLTQGIPYLITEHWSRYLPANQHMFKGWIRRTLTRLVVKRATAVTTVTSALADGMKLHHLDNPNYSVVPNVVDMDRFVIGTNPTSDKKILLHVGCFDEKAKNAKGMLDAVALLKKQRSDFTFRLVGTGEDLQLVKDYATTLGLNDVVTFTGLVIGDELVSEYQNAAAFVLFSNYETQGVVLLESFACGIPAIASNAGGIPEVMDPSRGILVEPGNIKELTNAMNTVLNGTHFASKKNIRAYVEGKFSNQAVGKQFSNLYTQTLNN